MNSEDPDMHKKEISGGKHLLNTGFRQYGIYSGIVFQMLATMGLGFWGGKKINDLLEVSSNLLTVGIGLAAMALALFNLITQLNKIQKNENKQ